MREEIFVIEKNIKKKVKDFSSSLKKFAQNLRRVKNIYNYFWRYFRLLFASIEINPL